MRAFSSQLGPAVPATVGDEDAKISIAQAGGRLNDDPIMKHGNHRVINSRVASLLQEIQLVACMESR